MNKNIWVYDVEVFPNLLTAVFKNVDSGEMIDFVMQEKKDYKSIQEFLSTNPWLVGFNSIRYDDAILTAIINNKTIKQVFEVSKDIIENDKRYYDSKVRSIDLMLINNYENQAKRTSLKWVSFAMREKNLADLPVDPNKDVAKGKVDDILRYNKIDVEHTFNFYKMCEGLITLRGELSRKYNNASFLNYSEPKIGKEIFLTEMSKKTGVSIAEISKGRTYYRSINLKDCISDKVKFTSKDFNDMLEYFNSKTISELEGNEIILKGSCDYKVTHNGVEYFYGVGGLHGAASPQVFESDSERVILDFDFASFYPMLAITQGIQPKHMGAGFGETYKAIYDKRREFGKGTVENYMYKIVLNSVFGQMKSAYTPFYDPKAFLQITINGQLFLSMLVEAFSKYGNIIQANTDGITFIADRKHVPRIEEISRRFEAYTGLVLEGGTYDMFVLKDVNNYIAVDDKGKVKRKGLFEVYSDVYDSISMHKNPSATVISSALCDYFTKGIPVEEYIRNEKNIHEFLYGIKKKRNFEYILWESKDSIIHNKRLPYRVIRYYVSKNGGSLYKHFDDLRITGVNVGQKITPVMNLRTPKIESFDIDYDFYIEEALKVIKEIKH
jgi:hypothetical protein